MKDSYKINEISKLYGIGIDSLRYYERLGILNPRRDTNGYRLYGLTDIYKLNMIRALRKLDFSMKQIKEYLDHQSVGNTLEVLRKEQDYIESELEKLLTRKRIIHKRITNLQQALTIEAGVFQIKALPSRPCVRLNEYITRDEEMDFIIKKIHSKHERNILDFGTLSIAASVSLEDISQGLRNVYHSVFFILENDGADCDFHLPGGLYLSYYYRGDYMQNLNRMLEALAHARSLGYKVMDDPFEVYEIDNRDTIVPEEFLTEIQIRIEPEQIAE